MEHNPHTKPLAERFRALLERDLSADELEEMDARNAAEADEKVCHSHDFLDANMTMLEAWNEVVGREPNLGDQDDVRLWNEAWNLMRERAA